MKRRKRFLPLLLAMALLLSACGAAGAQTQLEKTAAYLTKTVSEPQNASVGGEWSVIGVARAGAKAPSGWFEGYYQRLCETVREKDGVLDPRKNTEYSRAILALTAIGRDPRSVEGYDLTLPLADLDKTCVQGINGPIWALIALDSGGYAIPETQTGTQATREGYVQYLLEGQSENGAWALTKGGSDVDLTAMAMQALAKYTDLDGVSAALDRAAAFLSAEQLPNGGFQSYGDENSESVSQAILALCENGISLDDPRFQKPGGTLTDALERFACPDGSFRHTLAGEGNLMATEQALCALAAMQRAENGESTLYAMAPAAD